MKLIASAAVLIKKPGRLVAGWLILAVVIGLTAPNLTRLAAEGQAKLLSANSESGVAAELLRSAWPDQSYTSMAVLALHRPGGLTDDDRRFAKRVSQRMEANNRPREIRHVLGPHSEEEVADRLVSSDHTVQLFAFALDSHFVAPATSDVVSWLKREATSAEIAPPAGLEHRWTGDAIIGIDYMAGVQTSLDRAAVATVILLLIVLLVVYRSFWLSMVPLVTIGISLVIARGVLAWLYLVGWEISPLVELFLVAILFGTGTDFCLFLSWRFAEHFNPRNPAGAMWTTLVRSFMALVTSAGTIIVGLLLMGTTQFKLFSTTGPSVALGLFLSLLATLTLTPALLVLLARHRPQAFHGLIHQDSRLWDRIGRAVMAKPFWCWAVTILLMLPLALVSLRTRFLQDIMSELPKSTASVRDFSLLAEKFGAGMAAPLTVVLESDTDLRTSQGLALIDDVSRLLSHQRRLAEVRSATQPLGTPEPLKRARIGSRLGEVNAGFDQLVKGASHLQKGLSEGAAKLKAALWLEQKTGLSLTGGPLLARNKAPQASTAAGSPGMASAADESETVFWRSRWDLAVLNTVFDSLSGSGSGVAVALSIPLLRKAQEYVPTTAVVKTEEPAAAPPGLFPAAVANQKRDDSITPASQAKPRPDRPQETLLRELNRAADGASQIANGAQRASKEVSSILHDPVGRQALDRLLITSQTVKENPDLLRSFAAYITPDGRHARIDLVQQDRVFSNEAMDHVDVLRRRLKDYLGEYEGLHVTARIAGGNAESADVRTLTRADQIQSWFVVPIGVFLVLLISIRDPLACVNLVATMVLTYAFALGATHLTFVSLLGAPGLDWKVPYFLFVLLVAVGVDYNVFLMTRLQEEARERGLRTGIRRAIAQTGGLISSAAIITACSFASFLFSPLSSLRQLGFALVVGILIDATLVRPLLVPCGHWLLRKTREIGSFHSGHHNHKPQPQYAVFTD